VLIFQWTEDRAVPSEQARRLANALKKAGVQHEVVWFEGAARSHGPACARSCTNVKFLNALFDCRLRRPRPLSGPQHRLVP